MHVSSNISVSCDVTVYCWLHFRLRIEKMHQTTRQQQEYILCIDLMNWDDIQVHAEYSFFCITNETRRYALMLEGHSDTLPDGLLDHARNRHFSTFDEDNDIWPRNCATQYAAGWLHSDCFA